MQVQPARPDRTKGTKPERKGGRAAMRRVANPRPSLPRRDAEVRILLLPPRTDAERPGVGSASYAEPSGFDSHLRDPARIEGPRRPVARMPGSQPGDAGSTPAVGARFRRRIAQGDRARDARGRGFEAPSANQDRRNRRIEGV